MNVTPCSLEFFLADSQVGWSLTVNSTTPIASQTFSYKISPFRGPQYFSVLPHPDSVGTFLWANGAANSYLYVNLLPAGTQLIMGYTDIGASYPTSSNFQSSGVNSVYLAGQVLSLCLLLVSAVVADYSLNYWSAFPPLAPVLLSP